ncbi:MAG: hypothetical protein ACXVH1_33680 [Solirubrobacteraceae bacterium]
MGLLTTQQRSGPNSPISRFLDLKPFPLTLMQVRAASDAEAFVKNALSRHGGIRMTPTIATRAAKNLSRLNAGAWDTTLSRLNEVHMNGTGELEREVASEMADVLVGVGLKQSRNILQCLGLTRYVIPLDSRITKWLNDYGFPIRLSAGALGDAGYYEFVESCVQAICNQIGVLPCLLDAAIFSSFDAN